MLGLMFIETESFNESKQTSGYGVDLQNDLIEDKLGLKLVVFVEEEEEEEELWRALQVVEKKIMQRSCNTFAMEEAIRVVLMGQN